MGKAIMSYFFDEEMDVTGYLEKICLKMAQSLPDWDNSFNDVEDCARHICAYNKDVRNQLAAFGMFPENVRPSNGDEDEERAIDFGGYPWEKSGCETNHGFCGCDYIVDYGVTRIFHAPVGILYGDFIYDDDETANKFMALGFVFHGYKNYKPVYGVLYLDEYEKPCVYVPAKGNGLAQNGRVIRDESWRKVEFYKEYVFEAPTGNESIQFPFDWETMRKEIANHFTFKHMNKP